MDQGKACERSRLPQDQRWMAAEAVGSSTTVTSHATNGQVSDTVNEDVFEAGRIKHYLHQWKKLTSDPFTLKMVTGTEIPMDDMPQSKNSKKSNSRKLAVRS